MGRASAEAGAKEPGGKRPAAPSDPVAAIAASRDAQGFPSDSARQRPLEQALAYYRDLYDAAPVGYLLLDAEGGIEDINRTGAAILGWVPDWLVGKPFARWVMREDRPLFARHLRELQEPGGRLTQELRIKTRSGWPLQVRLDSTRSASEGNGSTLLRTIMVDVSTHRFAERQARLMQSRLAHAARVSAVGAMASCLAHDLSQPLGTITLNCDAALRLVRTTSGDREQLAEALVHASAAAAYAGEITRHLRRFLRKDGDGVLAVALPALISEAIRLVEAEARDHDVSIEVECAQGLPAVLVEPVHIEQVLVNLVSNSIEAMRNAESAVRRVAILAQRRKTAQVQVCVRDTGPGMNGSCAAWAFQPFYTTKDDGMGLGLSVCRSIIEAHGGKLWLGSSAGAGAALHFTLPAVPQ